MGIKIMYDLRKLFIIKPNILNSCIVTCKTYEYRVFIALCAIFQYYYVYDKVMVQDVHSVFSDEKPNYVNYRNAVNKLKTEQITLANGRTIAMFRHIDYYKAQIEFKLNTEIEDMLINYGEKEFTRYNLIELKGMKIHDIRLHEVLKQYMSTGKVNIELNKLSAMCGIHRNNPDDKRFRTLKLLKAKAKDIDMNIQEKKIGLETRMLYLSFKSLKTRGEKDRTMVLDDLAKSLHERNIQYPLSRVANLDTFHLTKFSERMKDIKINFDTIHNHIRYVDAIVSDIEQSYIIPLKNAGKKAQSNKRSCENGPNNVVDIEWIR